MPREWQRQRTALATAADPLTGRPLPEILHNATSNAVMLTAFFLCLLSAPATAKINLSGGLWITYWAQQQAGDDAYQLATATGWQDAGVQVTGASWRVPAPTAMRKTFLLSAGRYGGNRQTPAQAGYGFRLVADCPLTDTLKAYGCFRYRDGTAGITARLLYAAWTPLPQAGVRIGMFSRPFGLEGERRPDACGCECFVSEYAQDARSLLNNKTDIGIMLSGKVADGMFDYSLYAGNGVARTVADSASMANNASVTPDIDDAKQFNANLRWNVVSGAFIGGGYVAGDMRNTNTLDGVAVGRSRFSARDIHGAWDIAQALRLSAEYATVRHDKMALEGDAGLVGNPARTQLTAVTVNEYIVKAIWHGLPGWECGVRYSVIDPKSFEAELLAGYSCERKVSFAIGYLFANATQLRAEYSRVMSDYSFLNAYDPALIAGQYRLNPAAEPDDDIFALALGAQF